MANIIEISFKGNRREYYTCELDAVDLSDYVIVEADRGEDLGRVTAAGAVAERKCSGCSTGCAAPVPTRRVVRRAEESEVARAVSLRADEPRVRRMTREKVIQYNLKMKVSEAEWQFDRNKLTIYFTAERRVDFRELVRDLARTFRTRIELKQIGVRDEAALLGGVGRCGRELCCSSWLRELKPVSLQLAKDQRLSLNPAQISGCCGRLMCCLTYEHDSYVQARKRFPREGKTLVTSMGPEKVLTVDIWRERVHLRDEDGNRRTVALDELKREIAGATDRPATTAGGPAAAVADERTRPMGKRGPETERRGERPEYPFRPRRGDTPGEGDGGRDAGGGRGPGRGGRGRGDGKGRGGE
ncbi:MAG TPA: regulatory iron-sulfur-containing complex subunit RicT [Longimicrobiales bacterium]|nr:regulatory iron-sulfur-containing complex subunit RicT [Longimicrobiales bacterium]